MLRALLIDFVPDSNQLANIFSQAVAPAFLLGAVAAFISLLMSRLKSVLDRLADMGKVAASGPDQTKRKEDIAQLKRRAVLLNSATYLGLGAGVSTTLLLMISFASALFRLQHVFGGALLFGIANALLTVSLYKFAKEVKAGLSEIDEY